MFDLLVALTTFWWLQNSGSDYQY